MTPDQIKQKIETFVKREKRDGLKFVNFPIESSLRRAIIFGLELGKEAGNEMLPTKHDGGSDCYDNTNGTCYCFERNEANNDALTAKNAAIQELIDATRV